MQNRQQSRIDDQGFGLSHQFGQDGAAQVLQEAPELAHSTVERGGMKADDSRKQVREKPGELAQEGAFGFYPSKLLKEREGEDLGVREMLERGVVSCSWVEMGVSVIDLAEQDGYRFFQQSEPCGMLGMGHLILLWAGSQMAFVLSQQTTQHTSSSPAG